MNARKGIKLKKTQNLYICIYINQIRQKNPTSNPSRLIT